MTCGDINNVSRGSAAALTVGRRTVAWPESAPSSSRGGGEGLRSGSGVGRWVL